MSVPGDAATTELMQCDISPTDTPWQLKVQLTNRQQQPVVILRRHSPLDAWFSEFLQISQQDQRLLYQGAKAKRGEPGEEDLLLLLPGQQHTELLDLTQAYQLSAMPALVQFLPFALMLHPAGQPLQWQPAKQLWLQCPQIQLSAVGTATSKINPS